MIAKIVGVGEFLPGEPISNAKMEARFSLRADWVDAIIGTRSRHFAVDLDSGEVVFDLAALAVRAAERALASARLEKDDVDLIVLSTATPDALMPATVNVVADRLGIDQVATYQIQAGCAGSLQAIDVAAAFLGRENCRNALVVSADTCYKFLDLSLPFAELPPAELINLALFGDGAGALVLSNSKRRPGIVIEQILNRFEGLGHAPGQVLNWASPSGFAGKVTDERARVASAKEDYKQIEVRVPVMARALLEELLEAGGRSRADIRYFLPPQLAGKITGAIIDVLGVEPARCITRVADVGNTGNATPYFQLNELWQRMQPEEYAVVLTIESSKWLKTGMVLRREPAP